MISACSGDFAGMAVGVAIHFDDVVSGRVAELAHRYADSSGCDGLFVSIRMHLRLQGVPRMSNTGGYPGGGSVGKRTAR